MLDNVKKEHAGDSLWNMHIMYLKEDKMQKNRLRSFELDEGRNADHMIKNRCRWMRKRTPYIYKEKDYCESYNRRQ